MKRRTAGGILGRGPRSAKGSGSRTLSGEPSIGLPDAPWLRPAHFNAELAKGKLKRPRGRPQKEMAWKGVSQGVPVGLRGGLLDPYLEVIEYESAKRHNSRVRKRER
jgi:hypothetical protein